MMAYLKVDDDDDGGGGGEDEALQNRKEIFWKICTQFELNYTFLLFDC